MSQIVSRFSEILIGADPEVFVGKNGKFVSSHDLFPGTKKQPFRVMKGAIQVDGTAFEFNIHPASEVSEFLNNVETVVNTMEMFVKKVDPELEIIVCPTAIYDKEYFDALPEEAKALGCEPDYDAYTQGENTKPKTDEPFRTGAGHLHIGWTEDENPFDKGHFYDCVRASKQLDAGLYVSSLLWDDDAKRRQLYGSLGSFRPKSYGVEWRPLSNKWVSDPGLVEWVFEATHHSMALLSVHDAIFEQKFIKDILSDIREGKEFPREECLRYHDMLSHEYGYPKLPYDYLGAHG